MFSGIEQIGFARARRPAALRDATDRAFAVHENDRAACRPLAERVMSDLEALNLGEPASSVGASVSGRLRSQRDG